MENIPVDLQVIDFCSAQLIHIISAKFIVPDINFGDKI